MSGRVWALTSESGLRLRRSASRRGASRHFIQQPPTPSARARSPPLCALASRARRPPADVYLSVYEPRTSCCSPTYWPRPIGLSERHRGKRHDGDDDVARKLQSGNDILEERCTARPDTRSERAPGFFSDAYCLRERQCLSRRGVWAPAEREPRAPDRAEGVVVSCASDFDGR